LETSVPEQVEYKGGLMAATGKKKKKIPPIDQEFIDKMEASLLSLKAVIVDNLIASNQDFKEIMEGMDSKDLADIASDDIDRKMIEAIGSQELKRLKLIESALTRIKQGKYGHCIKCSRRIPQDRLIAIPYALMCIECKSEEERRNR
jgi:RNA polymerase-binding transcription factor DksA